MTATGWADTVIEDGPAGWPAERTRLERANAELLVDLRGMVTGMQQMGESVRLMAGQRDRAREQYQFARREWLFEGSRADTLEHAFRSLARSYGRLVTERDQLMAARLERDRLRLELAQITFELMHYRGSKEDIEAAGQALFALTGVKPWGW